MALLFLAGCATTDDLRRVQGDLHRRSELIEERLGVLEQGLAGLKADLEALRREGEKNASAMGQLRGSLAEARAEITEIREHIQQLRGASEALRRDVAAVSSRSAKRDDEEKALRERIESLTFKVKFMEDFLEIGRKEETPERSAPEKPAPAAKEPVKGKTDKESLYAAAYELFKAGKYEKAREGFEQFLKQYPDTEFSDNAQFWVGECYYFDKKYEKAIVEYDKVVKNYPNGDKVPNALLKQALSFLRLGDKTSAKLLLQQVIRDFPNTSQARVARAKLAEVK